MRIERRILSAAAALAIAGSSLLMAGCSGDDIAFNGKIFDAVGINGSKNSGVQPKMVARQALVIPPSADRLPEPGRPAEAAQAESTVAALNDPEKMAIVKQEDLERQQAEYCKVNYHDKKLHDNKDVEEATGPLGPCRGSFLNAYQAWNKKDEPQEGQVEQ